MEKFEDFIILDEILENINLEEWDLIFEEEKDNLTKEVGGMVGGLAAGAVAAKAIHKNSRKNAATRVLAKSNRTGNLTANLLTTNKKKFIRALRKLKFAFSGKNLPKSLGLLGLSIAIGNLVFSVGSGIAKGIIGKLQNLKKKELELDYKKSVTDDKKEIEKIEKEIEQINKNRQALKTSIEAKIESKKKLPADKLAQEKEKAKTETKKLISSL
jgi:hypothetical protein